MKTNTTETTVKLNNGIEVLAKLYKGQPSAVTYANRTQAEMAVAKLGAEWCVYRCGMGRPFYVARVEQTRTTVVFGYTLPLETILAASR